MNWLWHHCKLKKFTVLVYSKTLTDNVQKIYFQKDHVFDKNQRLNTIPSQQLRVLGEYD